VAARLDAELVRRGLARSRSQARAAVEQGRVSVDGRAATKASVPVDDDADVRLEPDADDPGYVSRGGYKLAGALDALQPLGLTVHGWRCLDAGASTGGFTDVLLRRGAVTVVAVDVGHDQLVSALRADPRVDVREGVSVRGLQAEQVGGPVDLVVADLSFISLTTVLPSLADLVGAAEAAPGRAVGELLVMVKPQFEVGRARLSRSGVVSDPALRALAVDQVVATAAELGLQTAAATVSPLPGPAGNVEFFLWLRSDAPDEPGLRWDHARSQQLVRCSPGSGAVVTAGGPAEPPVESVADEKLSQ
jgi:23S rRNA (cytidine1920-2'-O)/16S rRNA (cytidine1409-2'-O)-methyltransferase